MSVLFEEDFRKYPSYRKPLYDASGRPIVGSSYRRDVTVSPALLFGQGEKGGECLSYAYDYAGLTSPQGFKRLTWREVDGIVTANNTTSGNRANYIEDQASFTKEENDKFSSPGDAFSRAEEFLSELDEMWASFRRTPQELISLNQSYIPGNRHDGIYDFTQDNVFDVYVATRLYNRLVGNYSLSSSMAVAYAGYTSAITGCLVAFPTCRPGAKIKVSVTLAIYNNSYRLTLSGIKYSVEVPSFSLVFRLINLADSWDNVFSPPYSDFGSYSETAVVIPKTVSDGINNTSEGEVPADLVLTVPKARWGLLVTDMSEFEAWAKTTFLPALPDYLSGTETRGTKNRGGNAEVGIKLKFNGSASTSVGAPVAP